MRFLTAALLVAAQTAFAQAPPATEPPPARNLQVVNDTGRTVVQLYIHPAGTAAEGDDRLGQNTLAPRASLRVPLGRPRACQFAVRAVLDDGGEERRRVDVCRNNRVTLAETGPRREVTVVNATDLALRELYLAPGGEGPGPDRLGADTVAAGATQTLRLRGLVGCVVELRAVFEDDSVETRSGLDVCRVPRLVFGDPDAPIREVSVANRGRGTVRELYVRPAGAAGWGPDRLGAAVLEPRATTQLRLRGGCLFDWRAVRDAGQPEIRRGVDICANTMVAFGGEAAAGTDAGERRVTLVNGFVRAIREIYLSAAETEEWGEDRLGDAVLTPGTRREFRLDGGCLADLRIVFDNEAAEERRDLDICTAPVIALRPGWTVEERRGSGGEAVPAGSTRLRNTAALPIVALFVDPPGAARGPDRLGATVLGAGESMVFAPPEGCEAALTAIFRDGREATREKLDFCAGEEVVLP